MTKIGKYNENICVNGVLSIKDGTQGANYILTSDSGGTATWISQSGLTSGISALTIANTVFVSKNGNDSTGLVERGDRPFLTISAAKSAVTIYYTGSSIPSTTNRILIKVNSGNYNEPIVLGDGIDYDLTDCILELQSGSSYVIDDNNVACDSIIYGNPQIIRSTSGTGGCIRTQNAGTNLRIYANIINSNTIGEAITCTNGTQTIIAYSITSAITGLNATIDCVAGNLYVECKAITNSISNTNSGSGRNILIYGGTVKIKAPKIMLPSAGSDNVQILGGSTTIIGDISTNASGSAGIDMAGNGILYVYGNVTNVSGQAAVATAVGSCYIYGDISSDQTQPVQCFGGTLIINNSRIVTTASNADSLIQSGGVCILNNCTLIATGTGASISAGSTVKIYSGCQANLAVGAGVTQQVGSITVDVNVV